MLFEAHGYCVRMDVERAKTAALRVLAAVLFSLYFVGSAWAVPPQVTAVASTALVPPGAVAAYTLHVLPMDRGTVTFRASGLPAGANATFTPSSLAATGLVTMRVTTAVGTASGPYRLTVTASRGTETGTATVDLQVAADVDFRLEPPENQKRLTQVEAAAIPLRVAAVRSGSPEVTLTATGLPAGYSVIFQPDNVTETNRTVLMRVSSPRGASGLTSFQVTGRSGSLVRSATVRVNALPPTFKIFRLSRGEGLRPGKSVTQWVALAPYYGFDETVELSATGLPPGVTATFQPRTLRRAGFAKMILSAATNAPVSRGEINVIGRVAGVGGKQVLAERAAEPGCSGQPVTVGSPDFELTVSPSARMNLPGQSSRFTVALRPLEGFASPVTLSLAGLPAGATAQFAQTTLSGESSTDLEITTPQTLAHDTYVLSATGSGGGITRCEPVTLTISDDPGITVFTTPRTTVGTLGQTVQAQVRVASLNGFSGTANLAIGGMPDGVVATLASTSLNVTGSHDVNLTFAVGAGTVPGTYPVSVMGVTSVDAVLYESTLVVAPRPAAPWSSRDIGTVSVAGVAGIDAAGGNAVMQVSGVADWSQIDSASYLSQPLLGDGEIIARVTGIQDAASNMTPRVGLMIRDSMEATGRQAFVFMDKTGVPGFIYRSTGTSSPALHPAVTFPYWLKLSRTGTQIAAFGSSDGTTWSAIGTPVSIAMSGSLSIGLAATAGNPTAGATTTITTGVDRITVTAGPSFRLTSVPAPDAEVGVAKYRIQVTPLNNFSGTVTLSASGGPAGTAYSFSPSTLVNGESLLTVTPPGGQIGSWNLTIAGTGGGVSKSTSAPLHVGNTGTKIWTSADLGIVGITGGITVTGAGAYQLASSGRDSPEGLQYSYQVLSGDGEIVARLINFEEASTSSTAGVMIRGGLDVTAAYASLFATVPASSTTSYTRSYRSASGGVASNTSTSGITLPIWLKLIRVGSQVTAYQSANGSSWTQVGTAMTVTLPHAAYIGLYGVGKAFTGTLAKSNFDNVAISAATNPGVTDFQLTAAPPATIIGNEITYNLVSTANPSFSGTIALTATGLPTGVTGSFQPASLNGAGQTQLRLQVPTSTANGSTTITATGTSGAVVRNVSLPLITHGTPTQVWTANDVGAPGTAGSTALSSGSWTLTAGSGNVMDTVNADAFQFAYRPLSGDGYLLAKIVSRTTGAAGIMLRESMDPRSKAVFFGFHNDGAFASVSRQTAGAGGVRLNTTSTLPVWVKLVRTGNQVQALSSTDGVVWSLFANYNFTLNADLYAGLVKAASGTSVFESVEMSVEPDFLLSSGEGAIGAQTGSSATFPIGLSAWKGFTGAVAFTSSGAPAGSTATLTPSLLAGGSGATSLALSIPPATTPGNYQVLVTGTSGALTRSVPIDIIASGSPARLWLQQDVGAVGRAGSATFDGNVWTVKGAGASLLDTLSSSQDSHSFVRTTLAGDFEYVARVVTKGSGWAGVLVRDSFETRARTATVALHSNGQVYFNYRSTVNGTATRVSGGAGAVIRWVKLVRSGNTFSGYHSANGTTWTQIGSTVTIAMPLETHLGLVVASESVASVVTATFDNAALNNQSDFTISALPATQNTMQGGTAAIAVGLVATGGYSTPVDLTVTGVPPGASAVFTPGQLTPQSPASTLSILVGSGTPVGTYPMTITGTAGAVVRTAPATVVVGTTDFTLTLNNTTRTVSPGGASTTLVGTVNALGGFNSDVTFTASGLPPGVVLLFNPTSIRGGGITTATITASAQAPLGNATVTITASSPGIIKTQTFTLNVANVPDYSLSSTVGSRTLMPGATTDIPITVEASGGFSSQVDLQVTGLPTGATAAFLPASVIAPAPSVLRIAAAESTPRGTYPLTVAGVSGALRRTLRMDLIISTASDYSLSLTPASATITAGQNATYTLTVTGTGSFGGTLAFDAVNLPDGAAASFAPATLTQRGTVVVTVATTAGTPAAAAVAFSITGTTGTLSRSSNTATLTINSTATFSMSAAPTTQVVAQSGVAHFPLTITPSGGFNSPVALSVTGAPVGSTITFDPVLVGASGGSSMLTVQVPSGATAQDYSLTVTGIGGGITKNAPVTLTVRTAASYEAEAPGNTLTGSATAPCTTCSNGQRVDGIGKIGTNPAATLRFNGVNAPASGLYALNVYYTNPDKSPRSATITVNSTTTSLSFVGASTGGVGAVSFATAQVYLESGANTIEFGNTLSAAPSIDRITVMNTATCTRSAIDVVHVIDCSGSVGGQPFSDAKNAAKQFIDRMDLTQDKVGVVSFTNTGVVRQQLTFDGAAAKTQIDALSSGGSTSIGAGIAAADGELASARHTPTAQKVMVLLSDGVNTTGADPMIAANAAKANGVRLITVGYGNHNATVMQALASSPSDYYAAPTGSQVAAVYDAVSTSVCRSPNEPPLSSAGPRQAVPVGQAVALQGAVSDDGQPASGILSVTWSKLSGPGTVVFGNANTAVTTATFSTAGDYVLRLTVSDGLLQSTSDVTLTAMTGDIWEAESITTVLSGGAAVVPCTGCSGGARVEPVGYQGPSRNGSLTFTVNAPSDGSYTLRVYYTNGDTTVRTANVSINGDTTPRSFAGSPTGGWNTVASTTLTAVLLNGTNTVRIFNDAAPAPSIDRIELLVSGGGTLMSSIASSPGDAISAPTLSDILPATGSSGVALCRPINAAPTAFAGPEVTTAVSQAVRLRGSASDDGLPGSPSVFTVLWSKISGPGNVVFSTPGSPSTDATFDAVGTYVLQLAANDGALNASSRVTVRVTGPVSTSRLQVTPGAAGPLLAGTAQAFEAKVLDAAGQPVSGVALQFTITGSNSYTNTGSTNTNGVVTFSYNGTNAGLDVATVTATSLTGVAPATASIAWVRPNANVAISAVTARFFNADTSGIFNVPSSQQPAFTEVVPAISLNPPAQPYTGGPAITGDQSPALLVLGDAFDNYIGNVPVSGNNFVATGGWTGTSWAAVFTGNLIIKTPGQYSLVLDQEGAMILGVGGGATRVSGPMDGAPTSSVTAFTSLPVMGAKNVTPLYDNQQTVRINFPTAGVYPFELDHRRTGPRQTVFLRYQEISVIRAIPPAAVLKITPVATAVKTRGEVMTITVRAGNEVDQPIAGIPVNLNVTGANPQQLRAATDAAGIATFQYTGQVAGFLDNIRATASFGASELRSGLLKVTWNTGTNEAPLVSAGPNVSVTMPEAAFLNGSVTDDGLPAASTLNIQWSQVSGPGTATWDNPRSPQARVTFSVSGTYVLRLTASDGALSNSADVTVIANPETTISGGWIGTPTNQSTVTGTVDITTIPGLTLTSGTLTIYPSNFPSSLTTINANTTGTGTIGTLDTTALANGTYWLRLQATNSLAQTQTSVIQIHVSGEFKPGRIQTSMTDVVVPLPGMQIRIERQYDSLKRNEAGDFGFGWRLGYNFDFQVDELQHVTLNMNGVRKTFAFSPIANPIFQSFYTPAYVTPAGMYGKLESTADTCNGLLTQTGGVYRCGLGTFGQEFQITAWKYTDPGGRIYSFTRASGLNSIQDLNGNRITIGPNGISSTAGSITVPIVRDTFGRITKITDPRGKDYVYAYGLQGDLDSVTYPGIATAATFTYDTGHLLKDYRDPRGTLASTRTFYPDGKLQTETENGLTKQYAYNVSGRVTTITNPDTGVEIIEQDAQGNVVQRTDGLNRVSTFTYDANNNPLTETNPENETTTYTYNAQGFRTSVKNHLNQTDSATFNAVGGPLTVTNGVGFTQSVTYDARYNLVTITDPIGQVAEFSWNPQGLPLTMKDARGNTSSYAYDAQGNRTSYTDPEGRTTTSTYNALGWLLTQTDPRGKKTTYAYDDAGRRTSMTDADNKVWTYEYDAAGNKTADVDPLSRRTTYEYDAKNRLTKTTYPDLTFTSTTYDFRDKPLTQTDQLGRVTKLEYDKAGQLTKTIYAFGTADQAQVEYTYDGAGRKLTDKDERGNITTYAYDDAGRMTSITNAQSKVRSMTYDAAGRKVTETDEKNHTTTYEYDGRGRNNKITYPDTKFVTQVFDGLGRLTSKTDQDNRTTAWTYDKVSQLIGVTDALSNYTSYGYDLAGNKIRQTDARGNATTYEYDNVNRRTRRTLPGTQYESFTYDAAGNMLTRRDFNGKTTTFGYDTLNRTLSITPDPSIPGQTPIGFTYSSTGKRLTMTDASGSTTWTYDFRDRVKTKATPQGTLTYTYHANGLVASVVSSNANGVDIGYAYDSLNRLQTVTDNRLSPNGATSYAWDDAGNPLTMTYPNGVVHTFGTDVMDRLSNVTLTKSGATLASHSYTFGFTGNKLTETNNTGRSVTWGYDAIYRLISETVTGDPTPPQNGAISYGLDAVANRLSRTSTIAGIPSTTNTFDVNDWISGDTFDANGNTVASGGHTYGYDFLDRLTSYDSVTVTMAYDGDGNRVSKTVGGVTTKYLVDDLTPTGYAQVAEELVGGSVARRYTHGTVRASQTQLIGGNWATHWYGYDSGLTVRSMTDSAGLVSDTYSYEGFGAVTVSAGTTPNLYRYRGEQWDPDVQMYYLRARWYSPVVGRFYSADPWEGCPRRPLSANRYSYAEANPVMKVDPDGRLAKGEYALLFQNVLVVGGSLAPRRGVEHYLTGAIVGVTLAGEAFYCIMKYVGADMNVALWIAGEAIDQFFFAGMCSRVLPRVISGPQTPPRPGPTKPKPRPRRPRRIDEEEEGCSEEEYQNCQRLFARCIGTACSTCLENCLNPKNCQWPFHWKPRHLCKLAEENEYPWPNMPPGPIQ